MKLIRKLDVRTDATIELVSIENREFIRKTATSVEVAVEKRFVQALTRNGLPHLYVTDDESLKPNQLLMEYVPDSITVGLIGTAKIYEEWGSACRAMHEVASDSGFVISTDGQEIVSSWQQFIFESFDCHARRHVVDGTLSPEIVNAVRNMVHAWFIENPTVEYRLIHGDLHCNNALVRNGEVVLFDKGIPMMFGSRYYDLIMLVMEPYRDGFNSELMEAFIGGYGRVLVEEHLTEIEHWTLLRCFEKFPGRTGSISGKILSRLLSRKCGLAVNI